ncbi:hypothetical protein [Longimicrobium terrae]|uniref:Uncharacterized protein n=1 Tax=Longimicrobium terrae TaxID=1639882 RepID=A0A841GS01_9BACT|nr:hypothetical protein [Longimicrobium terrae]MBB4635576.1 hypothetical protein [Longimicrobium terrae]MBB6069970.1 hypothetical protein [Longimicrobium terrae]NNC32881.1 hypothetical protein [Longimicrobium terrae]
MRRLRFLAVTSILLACAPGSLASQAVFASRTVLAAPSVDPRLVAPLTNSGARAPSDLDGITAGKRPWWAFPAAGLLAGGALGAAAIYVDCRHTECIGAESFVVLSAGAGATLGGITELIVRALR